MPQDLTTLLSKFLVDLYAGTLGTSAPFTSLSFGSPIDVKIARSGTNALQVQRPSTTQFILFQVDAGSNLIRLDGAKPAALISGPNTTTAFTIGTENNIPLIFNRNSAEIMRFNISDQVVVASNVSIPAGGSSTAVLIFGTTAGFGIYFGSGAPTVSAAKGSLYLRSDGTGTTDRMFVNTNGATTWTAVTTVA
jgi:hypothetical protein